MTQSTLLPEAAVETQPVVINEDLIDLIMGEGGTIVNYIPGYTVRQPQIDGAKKMLNSLLRGKHFLMEGPCGYGKSAVYLLAAILTSVAIKQRCVISTAGITLQEQLFYKDAPNIVAAIEDVIGDMGIKVAHLKGKNNFLCAKKVAEVEFELKNASDIEHKEEMEKLLRWALNTEKGDSSELDYIPKYEVWKEFACVDSNDCLGSNCEYNKAGTCFYQKARALAAAANVVICNYHLLFSDIQTGGKVLGEYSILVCDEAHEMAKIARDFQEIKVSYWTFSDMQKRLTHLSNKYGKIVNLENHDVASLLSSARMYFDAITTRFLPLSNEQTVLLIKQGTDIPLLSFDKSIIEFINRVDAIRNNICPDGEEMNLRYEHAGEEKMEVIKALDSIVSKCYDALNNLRCISKQEVAEMSYWFEKENNGLLSFHAKPVKVDEFLHNTFFSDESGKIVIATSATLSVNNSFEYTKTELGIKEADELIAPSPFNLTEQQLWYLPPNALEGNVKGFNERMIENLIELAGRCFGGMLCLFTSVYNMNMAASALRRNMPKYTILKQGDMPRQLLLERFQEEKDSILVATKSFFTGIDVRGSSLRCVVIDKLPFESPGDPVMSVLANEPNGFFKYMIPDMVITFKQAIGRGVRSKDDKCIIACLDNRLATARYKNRIANSFNYTKTSTRSLQDVSQYVLQYFHEIGEIPF